MTLNFIFSLEYKMKTKEKLNEKDAIDKINVTCNFKEEVFIVLSVDSLLPIQEERGNFFIH